MQPVAVATDAFLVVGIRARTTHRIEASEQTAKIPALWRRFFVDGISTKLSPRLTEPAVIAVYAEYQSDERGPYSLLIGHKVGSLDQTPAGLAGMVVPAGWHLCFTFHGSAPDVPAAAWREIRQFFDLSHDYERAYTADFEVHRPDELEICVAVK